MKFGIGQPVRRHEDLRLITGRGRYTDDVTLPRMTHAVVARSSLAHAHIKRVDAAGARRIPGVLRARTFAPPAGEAHGVRTPHQRSLSRASSAERLLEASPMKKPSSGAQFRIRPFKTVK